MDERRYREDEIREIFGTAARAGDSRPPAPPAEEGLTLADLQEIGREVGLPPERIADAASRIAAKQTPADRRTYLGLPISVGRTVDLPRPPTDREWEMLVAELRETFHARGRVGSHGSLREWTNGNLHAYVEPTETGHRLRLGTRKGDAMARNAMGIGFLMVGLIMVLTLVFSGEGAGDPAVAAIFGAMGAAAVGSNVLVLPRWARRREAQMERVSARALALIGAGPEEGGPVG